jgi:hypothetical protein
VRLGLPYGACSVEAIRAAHFIEHLTADEAIAFLNECWRVLTLGGVLQISTPNCLRSPGAWVLSHRSYYTEATFTHLERAGNWQTYGIRIWHVKQIVTNRRGDIHAWLEPRGKEAQ